MLARLTAALALLLALASATVPAAAQVGLPPYGVDGCTGFASTDCEMLGGGELRTYTADETIRIGWQRLQLTGPDGYEQAIVLWEPQVRAAPREIARFSHDGRYGTPELENDGLGAATITVKGRSAGTGSGNIDRLFHRAKGASQWREIDTESWKQELAFALPRNLGVWKGVDYFDAMSFASFPLWRDSDANCCPSGGSGTAVLEIRDGRLALADLSVQPAPAPGGISQPDQGIVRCPITRLVYSQTDNHAVTAGFSDSGPPERRSNYSSDLLFWVERGGQRFWFGFAAPNGYGGTFLYPRVAPGAEILAGGDEPPVDALIDARGRRMPQELLDIPFDAFDNALAAFTGPPQSHDSAPALLFSRELGRMFHYDVERVGLTLNDAAVPINIDFWRPVRCLDAEAP